MKNSQIAARTVRARQATTVEPPTMNELKLAKTRPHTSWTNVADQIAKCDWFYKNHCVDELKTLNSRPADYHVDRCYPNAEPTPLYVDFPMHPSEADNSRLKQKLMLEKKMRMVVVERDTTLDQALIQLGEL